MQCECGKELPKGYFKAKVTCECRRVYEWEHEKELGGYWIPVIKRVAVEDRNFSHRNILWKRKRHEAQKLSGHRQPRRAK